MVVRFGLTYSLKVEGEDGNTLIVKSPLTIEFDIVRNIYTSMNICRIKIYNLSESNRSKLRFSVSNSGTFRAVELSAGYESSGSSLTRIFKGNVTQAWSVVERVDYVTYIECRDGLGPQVDSVISKSYAAGTQQIEIIKDIVKELPGISIGAIGKFLGTLSRGNSYFGSAETILQELTSGCFFIDSSVAHAIKDSEYIDKGDVLVIDSDSGLLDTPILEQYTVRFDLVFEPALEPGILVKLNNLGSKKTYDGNYKILLVRHKGMIGGKSSKVVTSGEFQYYKVVEGIKL